MWCWLPLPTDQSRGGTCRVWSWCSCVGARLRWLGAEETEQSLGERSAFAETFTLKSETPNWCQLIMHLVHSKFQGRDYFQTS